MAAWKEWLNSLPVPLLGTGDPAAPLDALRDDLVATISDCDPSASQRLRFRIARAGSADELWLLRGDLFHVIAARHCQSVAATRINALLPTFRRWLPRRRLAKV